MQTGQFHVAGSVEGEQSLFEVTHYRKLGKWSAVLMDGSDPERNPIGPTVTAGNYKQLMVRMDQAHEEYTK